MQRTTGKVIWSGASQRVLDRDLRDGSLTTISLVRSKRGSHLWPNDHRHFGTGTIGLELEEASRRSSTR